MQRTTAIIRKRFQRPADPRAARRRAVHPRFGESPPLGHFHAAMAAECCRTVQLL